MPMATGAVVPLGARLAIRDDQSSVALTVTMIRSKAPASAFIAVPSVLETTRCAPSAMASSCLSGLEVNAVTSQPQAAVNFRAR